MEEEKRATIDQKGEGAYYKSVLYGKLVGIGASVDMGWNQRGAGRSYNSPSGMLCAIGYLKKKIIDYRLYIKKCIMCNKIKEKESERLKLQDELKTVIDEDKKLSLLRKITILYKAIKRLK